MDPRRATTLRERRTVVKILASRRYRIGDVIAVTQRLDDGSWLATFPGFTGFGLAESDALIALAAEVEGASKCLRLQAIEVSTAESSEPIAVVVRTYTTPRGDVCGQIVSEATGEILHECGFTYDCKTARHDAEQVATRKGYRVVEVSK
jgi:hypothetical protein